MKFSHFTSRLLRYTKSRDLLLHIEARAFKKSSSIADDILEELFEFDTDKERIAQLKDDFKVYNTLAKELSLYNTLKDANIKRSKNGSESSKTNKNSKTAL